MFFKVLKKIIFWSLLLALLGGAGWYGWRYWKNRNDKNSETNKNSPDKLFTVKRGNLTIGVTLSGSVNTKVKHKLALEVPTSTKLVSVVEENTKVSAGEIVARFETETLQTSIDDLKVSIADAEKNLELAQEELAILISSNEADIKTARDNLDDAVLAYNKLRKLEGPKNKNSKDQSVSDASQKLVEAQTAYETAYDNYFNPAEIADSESEEQTRKKNYESALKSLKSARISYRNALLDRKIFKRYSEPDQYKTAKDKVLRMELALKKEQVRTESSLAQKKSTIANAEVNLRKKERDLEQKLYEMTKMQLVAPVDGFVSYGDTDRNRWGRTEIKVGMDVYRRQTLATIPDMSQMIVDVDIPESYRSKVRRGASVIITPDSVQNLKINGILSNISPLPILLIPWDPSSAKAYKSTIQFYCDDPRVVSGINVRVEIVTRVLENVFFIPVEAVFEKSGQFFVYRDNNGQPEEVIVEIGASNDNYVEIQSGLNDEDVVYLYRPFQQDKTE